MLDEDIASYWSLQKNYCLFQKYYPNNNYDTRITIIGNRAFGVRRFTRNNDFRASGSGKTDYNKEYIDLRMIKIAFEISNKFKFQSMGYDFIYDEKKDPIIVEMSYTFPKIVIDGADGYWDSDLIFHKEKSCSEYYQLVDLIKDHSLKMPNTIKLSN